MSQEDYRVGRFWLTKRPDRQGWWIAWYDQEAKQRRLRSAGTGDFQEAVRVIHAHAYKHEVLRNAEPEDVPLARVLLDYWEGHAKDIPSHEQARIALNLWTEFFGGESISDLTPDRQRAFVDHLKARGHSLGYISRTLSCGRAALRYAWRAGAIKSAPFVADVETENDRRSKQPKGRPLSLEEMGRFLDAIKSRHLLMLTVIAINTMSRPDALLSLTRGQCDHDSGIIDLNPPGRKQTKKYRPVVPMTQTVRPWLLMPPEEPSKRRKVVPVSDHVVTYHGRPVASVKKAWRLTREAAGLDARVNLYSIRHTLARDLRRQRVDPEEIDIMLGHLPPGKKTSLIYAPYAPDYCVNAAAAIDDFCARLQAHTKHPITTPAKLVSVAGILQ